MFVTTDFSDVESNTLTYAVTSGSLPPGISLSSAGAFSGNSIVPGVYNFSVTATETNGSPSNLSSGAKSYSFTIDETSNDAPVASGGTRTLTAWDENSVVSGLTVPSDFTDEEGNNLTYAVVSGSLPPGMSLSSAGTFSGTPTVPGLYTFAVEATETNGSGGNLSSNPDKNYSWTVNENGNDAPVASGGTRTLTAWDENSVVSGLTVPSDFTDEEGNSLTYAVVSGSLPPGMSLSSAGTFSGTPTVPGLYTFAVEATETNGSGGNLSSNPDKNYSWTVNENGNDAPVASVGTQTLSDSDEDALLVGYSVAGDFSDEENNTLNYAVTVNTLPSGINLNSGTGDLTGTPTVPGMYSFSIRATETDGAGGNLSSSDKAYEWEIVNVNDAPQITTNNGLTLLELTTATITSAELAATDEDTADTAAVLTYTITTAPSNGTLFHSVNGALGMSDTFSQDDINNNRITYQETTDDATSDSFIFDLDDAAGDGPTGVTFNITVTLNAPPVVTAGGSLDYVENDGALALADAITVTDVESDDIVSATVQITGNYQNGEDVLGFTDQNGISGSFNSVNGLLSLSGTATIAEYQAALRSVTYTNTSEHPSTDTRTVSFRVSDANLSNTATRDINVTRANDAPTSGDRNININEDTARALIIGDFTFNDVDGSDTLAEVRIVQVPGDGSLMLNGAPVSNNDVIVAADLSGGNLVFTPDLNETGSPYATIQFQVSDGTVFSSPANTLTINVGADNDAPQAVGGTVTLTAVDENSVLAGVTVTGGFTDAENNDLDYALTSGSLPTGVNLTAATGELTGSPTVAGVYGFGITATETDGDPSNLSSAEQSFSWTINEAFNDTPQATGGTVTLTATNENVSLAGVSVAGDFSDEDSNDLDYAVTAGALPDGVSLDTATGELSGTTTVPGDYAFSITATEIDGNPSNLSSAPQDYGWQIIETVNDAPVAAGGTITLPVAVEAIALSGVGTASAFSDEEDNTLSYSVTSGGLPSGVSLNAASGELTGTPTINGVFNFGITATETDGVPGDLSSAEQAFSLTVTEVNDAPVTVGGTVVLSSVIAGDPIVGLSVVSAFSDEENNTLSYFISGGTLPSGVSLNAASGALEGIPMSWSPPAFDFNVVATETNGVPGNLSSVAQAFSLTVNIVDTDADTVPDFLDNCPLDANLDQLNNDADSAGDVCDDDDDNDGMPDAFETDNGFDPFDAADAAQDSDSDGRSNLDEFLAGGNPNSDDVPPVFSGVQDIVIDASGYLTPVELGDITAADVVSGSADVSIESVLGETSLADVRRGVFRTGRTVITRSAIDSSLNVATVEQTIDVRPLANFAPDLIAAEGGTVQVVVLLNGVAPQYPVTLDYAVSGSSDGADHNVVDGTVTIVAGTEGMIDIDINPDTINEGDETLVLTLSDPVNAALGGRTAHTVTIVEGNAPPVVEPLQIQQGIFTGPLVVADRGLSVAIMATVNDPNAGDTPTYEWSGNLTQTNAPGGSMFEFDPAGLAGIYTLTLTVTDNNGAATTIELLLSIKPTAPLLSSVDSDSDGIADDLEGYADSDGDGVPDHLDAYEAIGEAYLGYNQTGNLPASKLLQTEPGLGIRLGAIALHGNATGILVDRNQITSYATLQGSPLSSLIDSMVNLGGLYDFEVYGMQPGGSANVVIPLLSRILEGAVYRKFSLQNGWHDFDVSGGNSIASARSVAGLCPAPGHASYRSGLNVFDDCLQLTLVDGGPNDADGQADGVIRDPGGVAVADVTPEHETPEPDDGSGGGALHPWLLFGLFGWWMAIIYRQRARA